jgi:hypothetical protein
MATPIEAALVILCAGLMAAPPKAAAQVASSLVQLQILVEEGDQVAVTRFDGTVAKGKIESVSASSVRLLQERKPLDVPESEVLAIRKKDSIRNGTKSGAVIGGGVGAGLGTLGAIAICSDFKCTPAAIAAVAATAGIGAGIGALVGVTLDSVFNRNPVVYRAAGSPSARIRVMPLLSKRQQGVQFSLSF